MEQDFSYKFSQLMATYYTEGIENSTEALQLTRPDDMERQNLGAYAPGRPGALSL